MKYEINEIMDMLDWNNSIHIQEKGCELAKRIKCINVFLQPNDCYYNKNVWENCAKILSQRTDEELSYYLTELFNWLKDMTWPGASIIYDRLKRYKKDEIFDTYYNLILKKAKLLQDDIWYNELYSLKG